MGSSDRLSASWVLLVGVVLAAYFFLQARKKGNGEGKSASDLEQQGKKLGIGTKPSAPSVYGGGQQAPVKKGKDVYYSWPIDAMKEAWQKRPRPGWPSAPSPFKQRSALPWEGEATV